MHDPNLVPGKRVLLSLDQSRPPLELKMLSYINCGEEEGIPEIKVLLERKEGKDVE